MWFLSSYPEVGIQDIREEYDYVVIGGGTAGCVLANRLSASPNTTVLLVEQGGLADDWASRVPLLSSDFASNRSRTMIRQSEYQPELGRSLNLINGSALGGSSVLNQMLYTRGLQKEYDLWAASGCPGWNWTSVSASFKKSEKALDVHSDDTVHGTAGEWCNRGPGTKVLHYPGFNKAIDACSDVGLPFIEDLNSPRHPTNGCGLLHFTRDENQHRHSTYRAFLPKKLAQERQNNLHIATNITVETLDVVEKDGNDAAYARGLNLISRTDQRKYVKAAKEIILCAGPFGSPQILMLSGIGPADHLKEHDIKVVEDLPAVGSNLEDHFGVSLMYQVPMHESLVELQKRPWIFIVELFRYLFFGTGVLLAPVLQLAIFASSFLLNDEGIPRKNQSDDRLPDIEIMPMAYDSSDRTDWDKSRGAFSFLNVLLHPKSKGTVRLSSKDPKAPLKIDPRYLSDPADLIPLRASLKLTMRIVEKMKARGYAMDNYAVPESSDDAYLDKFIRHRNRTTYHYSSTCRMAPSKDASNGGGVVDPELRVFGVDRLRVADSSIFPWVLGAHLQAPTVCVAEKCAEFILKEKLQ